MIKLHSYNTLKNYSNIKWCSYSNDSAASKSNVDVIHIKSVSDILGGSRSISHGYSSYERMIELLSSMGMDHI